MSNIEKKYRDLILNEHIGESLYLIGVLLFLFRGMWQDTMFPQSRLITIICVPFAALLISVKILLYDSLPVKPFMGFVVVLLCMLASCYHSSSINPFFWSLLLLGSRKIDINKILKIYLTVVGTLMFLAFFASLLGIIENLQYQAGKRRVRNSFGIVYPTDFAAHIFYYLLVCFYLLKERLKVVHYVFSLLISGIVYYYCDARLDCVSIVLMVVVFWIGNAIESSCFRNYNIKLFWESIWKKIGIYSMPIAAVISLTATLLYREDNGFWMKLNKLLSNRLWLGQNGIKEYGITLWGQKIEMIGFGGTTEAGQNYNFVDCSYINIMLVLGSVFVITLLLLYVWLCKRHISDLYLLYCIALVAVNCMIAHHILQIEYNSFLLMLLMDCEKETRVHGIKLYSKGGYCHS